MNSSKAAADPDRREGGLAAISIIGAFLTSACCIVPLLLVTLGVSGAWIGSLTMLEPYKPYIAAATLVPLGFGFWQVYFKAQSRVRAEFLLRPPALRHHYQDRALAGNVPDRACQHHRLVGAAVLLKQGDNHVKHLSKRLVAAAALGLSGTIALPVTAPAFAQSASELATVKELTQTFAIENMYCALCPITVRKAVEGVTGVKSVRVDFEAQTATVVYDPSAATVAAIAAASTNVGYPANPIGS